MTLRSLQSGRVQRKEYYWYSCKKWKVTLPNLAVLSCHAYPLNAIHKVYRTWVQKNTLERNCQMSDPITTTPDPKHTSSSFRQQSYNFFPAAAVTSDFAWSGHNQYFVNRKLAEVASKTLSTDEIRILQGFRKPNSQTRLQSFTSDGVGNLPQFLETT